ncbi:gluconate 2-dehydrogenase subunit 3 family protein [Sporosarcina sp. PTS2304]|uniref:gluconate 2-dehydrogenase subunit 3 family protein n=1 Tax=Sporosarcina sp. PTS2304 TaxID=2283194 RepID=UPI000E0CD476|nr:gluconate 2-dehydrogenase subunit 3 family protein [Sporosarcina sp. PTS2304]AXH99740.1 gluconate 2-dehydrogenase subunit 3 family protein [Sporosarcina sp. PTS2304]
MDDNNLNKPDDKGKVADPSRRRFVKNTGIAVGGVAGGALFGGLFTSKFNKDKNEDSTQTSSGSTEKRYEEARMFFTRFADFAILEQAVERIYPEDKNGPGAIELGVPYFIDKQLAGPWGLNANDYRQGPFGNGNGTAADASLTRGELFINGLRQMEAESSKRFDAVFTEATEEQQLEILQDFADDKVKIKGISSANFFALLRTATLEGVYCDPLYGGNRDMKGWKMKEYPGAVASYANMIEDSEFISMDPVSLTDYQPKSRKG